MFSFILQLLIVLSIAGIILIILRRASHLPIAPHFSDLRSGALFTASKTGQILARLARQFWHFVLEVKGLSKNPKLWHLPKSIPKIHLPKARLPFWGTADTPEYFLEKGRQALETEDHAEAERKFIKAIEKDAHNQEAFDELGKLYVLQKKYREAIETYKFLTKHYPDNAGYFSKLGQAYHNQKLYEQAVEAYEKSIELEPRNAKRYVNLGLVLEAENHLEEAILNYRKAADLESNNPQFLMVLAEALSKKGEKEEAELLLEKILILEPTNHLAREKLMELKF